MIRSISVICPSRGRPDRLRDMAESARMTANYPQRVSVLVLLDRDDPLLATYIRSLPEGAAAIVYGERRSAPALYNELATKHARGELVVAASDDVVFQTAGWDTAFDRAFDAYPDELAVAYCGDGRGRDKVEHFVTSRRWIETVGYFMQPGYEHFSADEHVGELARLVGRLVPLPDVILEHRHAKYGKAPNDETYQSKRRQNMSARDADRFKRYAGERACTAGFIRGAITKASGINKGAAA